MCGDSHALSPAWSKIALNGEERLLSPALVTGLKHWHLRDESNFYPKKNFYRALSSLPTGSNVIFMFGEIDCREGLLVAVERCLYKDLEEGINTTVDIYIKTLKQVMKKYKFKVYTLFLIFEYVFEFLFVSSCNVFLK